MARYRILAPTFIGGSLRAIGEVVEYDGVPGSTLQAVDAKGNDISKAKAGAATKPQVQAKPSAKTADTGG